MMMIDVTTIGAALLASLGGVLIVWRGWDGGAPSRGRIMAALSLWTLSSSLWIGRFGAEIGIPLALETAALVALAFILSRIERRTGRAPRERAHIASPHSRWRIPLGIARALVAGPLGLAAAMGVAVVIATRAPATEQTRLIGAGLIVPTLWAIAIGWVVCHRRLPVQATALAAIGVAGFGLTLIVVA